MRTMKHTYLVEVAFLNTESDDINIEYVECSGYNARQANDYAVEYQQKENKKRGAYTPLLIQCNIKFYTIQLDFSCIRESSVPTTAYINQL